MGDDEAANRVRILDLIRLLLSSEDPLKKMDMARDMFNIRLDHDYIERVKDMGEIEDGFYQAGFQDGMEKGIEKGMEKGIEKGMEKQRQRLISTATGAVINIMDLGQPLEKAIALAHVPQDCIDEVKEQVLARTEKRTFRQA